MAFDEKTIAEIVRHRMGIPDGSMNVRITWAIPIALEQLARKIAANPRKRKMLLTLRDTAFLTITGGSADLAAYNTTAPKKLLLEYLHVGNIWFAATQTFGSVTASTDTILQAGHGYVNGQTIELFIIGTGSIGNGLVVATTYYVIVVDVDHYKLADTLADVASGTARDLTALEGNGSRRITGPVDDYPMHEVDATQSRSIDKHPLSDQYRFFWFDGQTIRVLDPASDDMLIGTLHFAVPYLPTLAQLAAIPELHGEMIDKVVELCAGPGNDSAEDGEH